MLADEESKRLYLYLIAYRLAGHHAVRIPVGFQSNSASHLLYKSLEKSAESSLPLSGMFGKLRHYDFELDGKRYVADCLGFEDYLFRRQYFFSRSGIKIGPSEGDHVIDGGACTGDTAAVFSNAVGPKGRVYAFDPVADHLEVLKHNARQLPCPNVKIMEFGISDRNVECAPLVVNEYSPGFVSGNHVVPLRTIDSLVDSQQIDRIDFLKLDVEGAELASLAGARQSILKFKPKIAVSLYHKPNDMFEIVLAIRQDFPFYNLYVDHYTIHQEETVLYCIS